MEVGRAVLVRVRRDARMMGRGWEMHDALNKVLKANLD